MISMRNTGGSGGGEIAYSSQWDDKGHEAETVLREEILPRLGVSVVGREDVGKPLKEAGVKFAVAKSTYIEDTESGIDYFFYVGDKNTWVGIDFTTSRGTDGRRKETVNIEGKEVSIDVFGIHIPLYTVQNARMGAEVDRKAITKKFDWVISST